MHRTNVRAVVAGSVLGLAAAAHAQTTVEFIFADPGTTFTGFFFPGNPLIGQQVVNTRIFFHIDVAPGFDAANLLAETSFPIDPEPGNINAFVLNGAAQGWSGSGPFSFERETDEFNGVFVATLYGGSTFGVEGTLLAGTRVEMTVIPAPATAALLAGGGAAVLVRGRRR